MIALLLNYIVHRSQQIVINENVDEIIITRKRSLRRLCFHRCLSVHRGSRSLSRGVSAQGGSLSRVWVSVQGVSVWGVSVQGGLCLTGSLPREDLHPGCGCLSRGVSVQGGFCLGALWRDLCPGYLCPGRISVQGVGLFPGCGSVQGGLCLGGVLCPGGSLSKGGLCRGGDPSTVTCGRYASYWNAFLFRIILVHYLGLVRYFQLALFCLCSSDSGNEYLISQDIEFDTAWDLWENIVALFCMTIIFLIISYIQLRRIKKYK